MRLQGTAGLIPQNTIMTEQPINTPILPRDPRLDQMRRDAVAIFRAGLSAVAAQDAVGRHCRRRLSKLTVGDRTYDLERFHRIVVVGAGKATATMAAAVETLLGDRISEGLISVKYGHTVHLDHVETIEAGHPLPDGNGVRASRRILDLVNRAGPDDLVVVLLSGGGSALLPLPVEGISLEEKQAASDVLIGCGASIHEINTIRKHLSSIKGGRLARAAAPAALISLVLSDVVGDDLDVIASGPTVADKSTFAQCRDILRRYAVGHRLPDSVQMHLASGLDQPELETPKPETMDGGNLYHHIVGSNLEAMTAAGRQAEKLGYNTMLLSSRIEGETRDVARMHAAMAQEVLASGNPLPAPACLVSGGETTVTLSGAGKGGRNQEFSLAAAAEIDGTGRIVVLSGGTDGTDGPTDAAGALADHTTARRALKAGLDLRRHLDGHDAYPIFERLKDLLITGPTGTNVMDLRVVLVDAPIGDSP